MRRALRYDGLLPHVSYPAEVSPALVAEMRAHADRERGPDAGPYDIVIEAESPADDPVAARAKAKPYEDAGATWWIESPWGITGDDADERLLARIVAGPPR